MNYNQNITLDLNTDNSYVVVGAKQGDTGRKITVNILQDGQPLDLSSISSNLSATYRVGQPNGGGTWADIPKDNIRTSAGTVVVIDLRDIDLDIPGRNIVDILLRENIANSGEEPNYRKISTVNFVLNVMAAPNIAAGAIKSEPFQHLEEIVEATETADYWADQAHMWANGKVANAGTPSTTNNSKYYADQAKISKGAAQTAQALAEAAQGHAEDAAEAAEASAEAAAEIAVVGADAVLNAYLHSTASTASGEIVEFSDGAGNIPLKSMSVDIEPVQDLNGFDYPWSSNGGQNMYTMGLGEVQIGLFISPSTHKINPLDSSTYQYRSFLFRCTPNIKYVIRSGINSTIRVGSFSSKPVLNSVATQYVDDKGSDTPTEVEITTNSSDTYLFMQIFADTDVPSGTTVEEYYSQALSGFFVSPNSNICPISGWTEAKILATGANILDRDACLNGWINASGQPNTDPAWRHTPLIPIRPGMSVTLSGEYSGSTNSIMRIHGYAQDGTWISNLNSVSAVPNAHFTVSATAPDGVYAIAISFNNSTSNVMLNFGLTELPFVPYGGTTIAVNWQTKAGTIYGGTLAYNGDGTWTLTITHGFRSFDGTEDWNQNGSSSQIKYFTLPVGEYGTVVDDDSICSHCVDNPGIKAANSETGFRVWNRSQFAGATVLFRLSAVDYQTLDDFKNYLAAQHETGTPVQVCYKFSESGQQTYTLTAESVKSLLGENQIWVDCGDISELTYRVDPNIHEVEIQSEILDLTTKTLNAYPTETSSGAIAFTAVGADNVPLKSLTVNITPIQSGSGDPSPTNIQPINGWTGAHVAASQGKNLIGGADMAANMKRYVPSTTIDADNVATFSTDADRDDYLHFVQLPYKENTQYTFILTISRTIIPDNSNVVYRLYYTDGTFETIGLPAGREANTKYTVVRTSEPDKTVAYLNKIATRGNVSIYCNESGVFEGVLTAADFVPYVGSTTAINWQDEAGTVYGGTLTYNGGLWKLVVTHKQIVLDGSRTWYQTQDSSPWYYIYLADMARGLRLDDPCVISDWLPQANSGNMPFFRHSSSSNVKNFHLKNMELVDESIVDATSLKSYLAQHPLTVVYAVDTDNAYDLTADEVKSLLGDCNVWADTGDVNVVFHCDPNLYIDSKISSSIVDAIEGAY